MRARLALAIALALPVAARAARAQREGDFVVHDFRFDDGERLPELRLHYLTLGTPRKDAAGVVRNAVLVLHGTTGSGRQFLSPIFAGPLYGPGEPLDTTRYYVILPDGIGHGKSSKPSDGMHARFPHYDYADMVRAQHRLLTEGLGVNHLRLVMGTSMGGMHTWMWGEMYPAFMDGLVPLASEPAQIAGRNRMLRRMIMDDITSDPEWKGGEYTAEPRGLAAAMQVLFVMTSSPLRLQLAAPTRDSADAYIRRWEENILKREDANDVLYAFDASRDYDPSVALEKIEAPLLAINSADDQVNPPEIGITKRLMPRVRHGTFWLIPTSEQTRGHGTHTDAAVWGKRFGAFLASLRER
ncbi:MAG TPA: alpha/beta fold hydrolase [Gemmatimonadaceae bacterium]